jgi:hypothetical protein
MNKLKSILTSDLVERALWTALQAGLAAWAVTGYQLNKVALGAVIGASLSALKTFIKNTL